MLGIDAVLQELPGGIYDIQIGDDGDILTADSFDTYILVALLTDRRANEAEMPQAHRRRGWIGNEHTPGQEMGSKLWLYEQSRLTQQTATDIQGAALEALSALVSDGLADSVLDIEATTTASGVSLELEIQRSASEVERRLIALWNNTGVR